MNSPSSEHGTRFWAFAAVGAMVAGVGVWSYLDVTADAERRLNFAVFLVGADLVHDILLVPLVCGVGYLVARVVPGRVRGPVQAGLMASGVLLLIALPPLFDTGSASNNPTVQPTNYGTATLTVLAIVWGLVALWIALALRAPRDPTRSR